MWISREVFNFLSQRNLDLQDVREELASRNSEVRELTQALATAKANFNWLATRVNQLEVERAQLLEKATGVKTLVPEISRSIPPQSLASMIDTGVFDDMGDSKAKELGLPVYN